MDNSETGGGVDVDVGVSYGGFAKLLDGEGGRGGIGGDKLVEGWAFCVFVFGEFAGDGADKGETEFELSI